MNTSASVVSSAFWLPEPTVEVGWEKPKTKPVQTEVEARLWKISQQTESPTKRGIHALIYTLLAGPSAMSVAFAFRSLNEVFANDGVDGSVNKFFR